MPNIPDQALEHALVFSGPVTYYAINDHLGTPQLFVDDAGLVVWQAEYKPFGKVNLTLSETENNIRFPGQYYDQETGLHYNWHRYYDPETGRYVSADPIGLDGGMNLYAYANSSPTNYIDPKGLVCGSGISDIVVPDGYLGILNFTYACSHHDSCYERCGVNKRACDRQLYRDMMRECSRHVGVAADICEGLANSYWDAVDKLGQGAFDNAQSHCDCTANP